MNLREWLARRLSKLADRLLDRGRYHVKTDPRETVYSRLPCLIEGSVDAGRGGDLRALSTGGSPLVQAARALLDRAENSDEVAKSIFSSSARLEGVPTFFEWTGVGADNEVLRKLPASSVPLPWYDRTIEDQARISERNSRQESKRYGPALRVSEFWIPGSCLSERAISVELARLRSLVEGYAELLMAGSLDFQDHIEVHALVRALDPGPEWKWIVKAGNHRAALMAALGMDRIPLRVSLVVRDEDALYWPGVKQRIFTEAEALAIFDRVYDAS